MIPLEWMPPLMFGGLVVFMLSLQGVSEIIKRIGALKGAIALPAEDLHYEKPMQ